MDKDSEQQLDAKLLLRLGEVACAIDNNTLDGKSSDLLVALLGFQRLLRSMSPRLVSGTLDHLDDVNTLDLPLLSIPFYVASLLDAYPASDPSARLSNLRASKSLTDTFINRIIEMQPVFIATSDSTSASDAATSSHPSRQLRDAIKVVVAERPNPGQLRESKIAVSRAITAQSIDFVSSLQKAMFPASPAPTSVSVPIAVHPFALLMRHLVDAADDETNADGTTGTVDADADDQSARAAAIGRAAGGDREAGGVEGDNDGDADGDVDDDDDDDDGVGVCPVFTSRGTKGLGGAIEQYDDELRAAIPALLRAQAARAANLSRNTTMETEMLAIRVDPAVSARMLADYHREREAAMAAAADRGPRFTRVAPGGVVTNERGQPSVLPRGIGMSDMASSSSVGGGAVGGILGTGGFGDGAGGVVDLVGCAARGSIATSGLTGGALVDVLRAAGASAIAPELAAADSAAAAAAAAAEAVAPLMQRPLLYSINRALDIRRRLLDNPNPPTETIDEYLERTNNEYMISQKDESKYDREMEEEANHSSDEEIGERKRRRAMEWDDWKETHTTGMGRRHNRL